MVLKKRLLNVIVIFWSTICFTQNLSITGTNNKTQYKWFDSIIRQVNLDLNTGSKYLNTLNTAKNNHQYYLSEAFQLGNVIYNEQPYFDVKLKYDIHFDELIIQLVLKNQYQSLILDKSKIQEFSINNKIFTPISDKNNTIIFVEELKKGEIILYKKHYKKEVIKKEGKQQYSHLIDDNYYVINYRDNLVIIKSKKDLKKLFPNIDKEINKLYRKLKSSKNKDETMINFITKIEPLFPKNRIIWTTN